MHYYMRVVLPGGHRALYFLPRDTFHTSYLTSRVSSAPLLAQPRVLVSLTRPLTFTPLTRDVCVFLFFSALAHSLTHTTQYASSCRTNGGALLGVRLVLSTLERSPRRHTPSILTRRAQIALQRTSVLEFTLTLTLCHPPLARASPFFLSLHTPPDGMFKC